jgi:hypothetical protein
MINTTNISYDILACKAIATTFQLRTVVTALLSPPKATKACRVKLAFCDNADHRQPQLNPLFGPLLKAPMGDCEICRLTVRAIEHVDLQRRLDGFNHISTKEYFNGSEHP